MSPPIHPKEAIGTGTSSMHTTVPQLLRNFAIVLANAGPDEDALVTGAVTACIDLLQARKCSVLLYDRQTNTVRMKSARGYDHLDREPDAAKQSLVYHLDVPDDKLGITGWIFKYQTPVTADDYDELRGKPGYRGRYDEELHGLSPEERTKISSADHPCQQFYGAPITLGDEKFGVLKVENKREFPHGDKRRFSEADRAALDTVAAMLALALKYARAGKDAQERLVSYYRFTVHAIRNEIYPIEGIKTTLSQFRRDNLDSQQCGRLELAERFLRLATDGVHFYLNNLLKFLGERLDCEKINLPEVLESELLLLRQIAGEYQIEESYGDGVDCNTLFIWGDRVFLSAVIKEVLRNARQAISKRNSSEEISRADATRGKIAIRMCRQGSEIVLEIADNGVATVSADERRQLLDSFQQATAFDARHVDVRAHARLGLSFIAEVVALHKGRIIPVAGDDFTRMQIWFPAYDDNTIASIPTRN